MRNELTSLYGERIVDSIKLLISGEYSSLKERGWIYDFSIQFLQDAVEMVDRNLYILPDIFRIKYADVKKFEDGRGHQIEVEVPLSEQVNGDMDAIVIGFEILNDGSFKITNAYWRNYEAFRSLVLKEKLQ